VRWRGFGATPAEYVARNSIASLCLWPIPAACLGTALAFWGESLPLQLAAAVFGISYTLCYRRVVGFRIPRWLVIRARSKSAAGLAAGADVGENAGTP
jgi:hypothetical protein